MTLLIAPTEPVEFRAIGKTSSLPELRGSDVLFSAGSRMVGIQRKAAADLVSSIYNGRLNHELEKMDALTIGVLLIEGKWRWDRDGNWVDGWSGSQAWTRSQMWAYMASVQAKGFWVVQTEDMAETIEYVLTMYGWANKEKHTSLNNAPIVPKADRRCWVLQQLCPGIGPEMSKRLIEANGDHLPLRLTMTREEIMKVPGWGPKRVSQLIKAMGDA